MYFAIRPEAVAQFHQLAAAPAGVRCVAVVAGDNDYYYKYIHIYRERGGEGQSVLVCVTQAATNQNSTHRLFSEFMDKAFDGSNPALATEWRDRFKAICLCKNIEELGLPSFISQCNGKPILVKHTANYFKGPGYAEININMHKCVGTYYV